MSSKSILNLSIKVIGVFYSLSALNMLSSSIPQIVLFWEAWKYTAQKDPLAMMVSYKIASLLALFTPILLFAFSLFITFKSERITDFLLRKEDGLGTISLDAYSRDAINLSIKRSRIFVLDDKQYIGVLPDDIGRRLIKFMKSGNKYEAYVKSANAHKVCVFLKETKRATKFKNHPSFMSTSENSFVFDKNNKIKNQIRDNEEEEEEEEN